MYTVANLLFYSIDEFYQQQAVSPIASRENQAYSVNQTYWREMACHFISNL